MIDDLILSQKPNEVIEKNHNFNFSLINSKFQWERKFNQLLVPLTVLCLKFKASCCVEIAKIEFLICMKKRKKICFERLICADKIFER